MDAPPACLVLHGNRMNGPVMRQICRRLRRKAERAGIAMLFPSAPYALGEPGQPEEWDPDGPHTQRQWWPEFLSVSDVAATVTTEPTLAWLQKLVEERNVRWLLGFSQGGHVAGRLVARLPERFCGVVLVNTYDTPAPDEHCACPALVFTSPGDKTVPGALAPIHYETLERVEHPRGHRMPDNASAATRIVRFMVETA